MVAEPFLQALLSDDRETALSYVWQEDREAFRSHLAQWDVPAGFPETGRVEVFIKKKGKGRRAGANFLDGDGERYGVDLRFIDGRWWVTRQ